MNTEYNSRVSSKNSQRLLKNLQNTTGDYFFCRTLYVCNGVFICRVKRQGISSVDICWQYATLSSCCHRHRVGHLVCRTHAEKQHRYRDQYDIGWEESSRFASDGSLVSKRLD